MDSNKNTYSYFKKKNNLQLMDQNDVIKNNKKQELFNIMHLVFLLKKHHKIKIYMNLIYLHK